MKFIYKIIGVLLLCCGLVGFLYINFKQTTNTQARVDFDSKYLQKEVVKEISIEGINSIGLTLISSDIKVVPTSQLTNSIRLDYKSISLKHEPGKSIYPVIEERISGEVLDLEFKVSSETDFFENSISVKLKNKFPFFGLSQVWMDKKVTLYVPSHKSFNSFKFNLVSGDVVLNDLKVSDLQIQNISGNISLKNMQTNALFLETTSGDINLENLDPLLSGSIETVSGNIDFDSNITLSKFLKINTVSGNVRFSNEGILQVNLLANSVSGEISMDHIEYDKEFKLTSTNNNRNIDINTISGDIVIRSN